MNLRNAVAATLAMAALAIPATAGAHIYPLSRAGTQTGLGSWFYKPLPVPRATNALGFRGIPKVARWRWFRSTVAWDSTHDTVLIGCRGHGTARVLIRVAHRSTATVCTDHQAWRTALRDVKPTARVFNSTIITPDFVAKGGD